MRILHALHGFPPEFFGGSELYVRALAKTQVAAGHLVEIVAGTNEEGPAGRETVEHEGLRVHRLRRTGLFHERWDHGDSPAESTLYREILREFQPDRVHVHHWKRLSRDLVRQAQSLSIPTVLTLHDLFVTCPRVFRVREGESFCERPLCPDSCVTCVPTEPWMGSEMISLQIDWFAQAFRDELDAASALVVPSRAHAEFLARHLQRDLTDFEVLPHGSILTWAPRERRSSWTGEGPLRIAHWGHLQELKGVHVLAQALAQLKDKSGVQLILWGSADDPTFDESLRSLLQDVDVVRRENFSRGDLASLDADIAVFPTLAHESHSFVLDEAFALGLPVLASDRGALPERVGKGGRVFPAGDAGALASILEELLSTPEGLGTWAKELPSPLGMGEHWGSLEKVYLQAGEVESTPRPGAALVRSSRYEDLVEILEARCREIDGLREKVTSEARHLERTLEEYEGSLVGYRRELRDKSEDLEAHRALVGDLRTDLESHRVELARVQNDFDVTEAALIAERQQRERLTADMEGLNATLAREREEQLATVKDLERRIEDADRLLTDLTVAARDVEQMTSRVDELEQSEARLLEANTALQDSNAGLQEEMTRLSEENAALLQEKQQLDHAVSDLTTYSTRLRRENRLALPLVLPARLLLAIKDRFLPPADGKSHNPPEEHP